MNKNVFVTGASGYLGRRLIPALLEKGYSVKALSRKNSVHKIDLRCEIIFGDALNANEYQASVSGSDTFIHLVGVAHPSPSKKEKFISVDLKSVEEATKAATENNVQHFIYLSVAQSIFKPMFEYQLARKQGEEILATTKMNCTFIRPLYIIGPGHYWPLLFLPVYFIF